MKTKVILGLAFLATTYALAFANEHTAVTFTSAATSQAICTAYANRGMWEGAVYASGTWDSGTLTLYKTYDNGTSKYPETDLTGVTTTLTADGSTGIMEVPQAKNTGKTTKIWGIVTGATNPNLSVQCIDANPR